ncbi:MAG TPA: aldo/keto reductase [Anaerolineaceae bacterium]|nr:aldo/keto reductase [Anaerolineaceae bacterium]
MIYRKLGKTKFNVSVVGVGTWQLGGEWGKIYQQDEVNQMISRAKELGINLIDTAECYGDRTSEILVGNAIKGQREDWIIATKFGHKFHKNFERTNHFEPKEVQKQLEESLRSLQTDYIDLYQFHSGANQDFDNPDLWDMLAKQVEAGKIRAVGLSITNANPMEQIQKMSEYGISALQIIYNRLSREPESEIFPICQKEDIGVLTRVPLASGFLSGKYKPDTQFTNQDDVRSLRNPDEIRQQLLEVEKIKDEEVPEGVDMAQWALAWCLHHPTVTAVIPGCKNVEQVEANAKAVELLTVK